jgi:hydroxypyruvate isomerase
MTLPIYKPYEGSAGYSAHIGYLFGEDPLEERLSAARGAGFLAVEHPNPRSIEAARLCGMLRDCGLVFAQMGIAAGDPSRGEKGLAALPAEKERFRQAALGDLDYAAQIDAQFVHPMAGVRPSGVAHDLLWKTYLENLSFVAEAADERGLCVLIEPIGRGTIHSYAMDTMPLAVQALKELRRPEIRILLDVFHAANDGLDPCEQIREHAALIGHIHLADHPGRHEPSTGHLDFPSIYRQLEAVGYNGFLGCEYIPQNGTREGLSWMTPAVSISAQ